MFAVRRGTVKWRGWKLRNPERLAGPPKDDDYEPNFQQKGVDLRFGLDIATFAFERSADRIVLVAGDTAPHVSAEDEVLAVSPAEKERDPGLLLKNAWAPESRNRMGRGSKGRDDN